MKKLFILLAAAAIAVPSMSAQDEKKLTVTPTGRILMDGAVYSSSEKDDDDKDMFKPGVAIPDVRIGVKATYGKWQAKIDVGFANNKVGLKDLLIQYNFNKKNLIRVGSFIHQYGLQSSTSSSMKCTYEEPLSNAVFNAARQIGVMYEHSGDKYLATASAHVEPQAIALNPIATNTQGFGLLTRQVYRPIHSDGNVVQVGMSAGFLTPQTGGENADHDVFATSSTFPTRVDKVNIVDARLTHSRNQWKFTPELLLAKGPVALEAQYFFNHINLKEGLHSFTGQGAYATLRGLLTGGKYGYNMGDGGLATPDPKQLELVVMYNYTTLSDSKAQQFNANGDVVTGVYGGRANTLSATLNYYINKYMLVRLNYAYTYRWNAATMPDLTLNAVQARLQIIF